MFVVNQNSLRVSQIYHIPKDGTYGPCENIMPPALAIAGGRKGEGPAAVPTSHRSFLLMLLTHCAIITLAIKQLRRNDPTVGGIVLHSYTIEKQKAILTSNAKCAENLPK